MYDTAILMTLVVGGFQHSDKAADYEFLCESARIPVHYCAEQFTNDLSISNPVMRRPRLTKHFFVTTNYIGSKGLPDKIRKLAGRGYVIGAHSNSPPMPT
jgi:hypothetical protein